MNAYNLYLRIMKRIVVIVLATLMSLSGYSQTLGDYQTTGTGSNSWSAISNWQTYNGTSWVAASNPPSGAAGTTITISRSMTTSTVLNIEGTLIVNPSITLTIGNPATSTGTNPDFIISSTGTVTNNGIITFVTTGTVANPVRLTVNGTLVNNNTLTITTNNTFVTINGTLKNSSTVNANVAAKLTFANGATYEHLFTTTAGNIPQATWDSNSTCLISGFTTNTALPGRLGSAFGNFIWNTPSLAVTEFNLGGQLTQVTGTLTITSTGSAVLYLGKSETEPVALNIGGNFIVSGTSAVNITQDALGNSITIGGSLTHSSSVALNAATGTGAADITISGDLSTSSAFNVGTGTLTFLGIGTAQSISGTVNVGNISVINDAGVNVEGTVNLTGSLALNSSTDAFDADGVSNSGVLTLLSTGDDLAADASIAAIPSGATFQGNVTVQRYMSGEGFRMYRYISSPVQAATVANWQDDFSITGKFTGTSKTDPSTGTNTVCGYALGTAASMFYFNEATQTYAAYPTTNSSAVLTPARGYSALVRNCSSPTVIDIRGSINQGTITLNSSSTPSLTFTTTGSNSALYGYNLVGNPYPSALDWESSAWVTNNISSVMATSDNSSGSLVYRYFDNTDFSGDDFIALGQAFWVRATGASPSLTFSEDVKAPQGSSYSFYRKASPVLDRLTITVSNGTLEDKAFVKVNSAAKTTLDNFDGPKMENSLFDLSTLSSDNVRMAINAVDNLACGSQVRIDMKDFTKGSYKFTFESAGLLTGYTLLLTDKYTNTTTNVTATPTYTFTVSDVAASKAADRFVITLNEKANALDLAVDTNLKVCESGTGKVKVYNTEANVMYFAFVKNELVGDTLAGGNAFIEFTIPSSSLVEGENIVQINAVNSCNTTTALTQTASITKYESAVITPLDARTLQSNYATGNHWYQDNNLLADTTSVLKAKTKGVYRLEVTAGNCILTATYALGAEQFPDRISSFPNPVEGIFNMKLPIEQSSASELPIVNNVGDQIGLIKLVDHGSYFTGQYDFSAHPAGLYLIRIESSTGLRNVKVLKK